MFFLPVCLVVCVRCVRLTFFGPNKTPAPNGPAPDKEPRLTKMCQPQSKALTQGGFIRVIDPTSNISFQSNQTECE